jgi:hypothetical protein
MRALLFRRTAFLVVLVTGLGLTVSAVHGLSGIDRELELAAVSQQQQQQQRPSFVNDHPDCDRWREPADRRV